MKMHFVLQVKCPYLLTDHNQTYIVLHAWNLQGVVIQENHSNGSSDMHENALCSPSKVPLITDRLQPNVHCSTCVEIARCSVAGKSLQWKLRYRRTATLFTNKVLLITVPSPQNFLCSTVCTAFQ
jgi:hypothetical protein